MITHVLGYRPPGGLRDDYWSTCAHVRSFVLMSVPLHPITRRTQYVFIYIYRYNEPNLVCLFVYGIRTCKLNKELHSFENCNHEGNTLALKTISLSV